MKAKNILIFGGSGQIGRHLIRKLTKNNYQVTAVTRNLHQKAYYLKTQANAGYLNIVEASIFNQKIIKKLVSENEIIINLIGILYENSSNTFQNLHNVFPSYISKICKDSNVNQLIHLSALGVDIAKDSNYAKSKLDGETNIKKNFEDAIILRPSVVYSVDDNFTTNFMTLLNRLPFFPLYYNGKTKFMPIHCSDLTEIIFQVVLRNIKSQTIECIGPETLSLKEILEKLLNLIDKKRILIPMPLFAAKISAAFFQLFPKPLLTIDQLNLLKYDNISSGNYKTNFDISIPSVHKFNLEVAKYCYMWKEEGQFSKKKNDL